MRASCLSLAALCLLASTGSAQAQIKTGIAPKPMSEVRAERAAKAERERARDFASAAAKGQLEHFDRLDKNRDARLSFNEFKEAQLDRSDAATPSPDAGARGAD